MKKQLLLSLLAVVFISNSFAQSTMEISQKIDRKITDNYTPNNNSKAGGGWFNYGREIETLSTDWSSSGGVLHPDSGMVDGYIGEDATTGAPDTVYYNVWHHSEGQILDPTSFNFLGLGDAEFFNVGEAFVLDTIEFPYQYFRPQTTNPDKLIVQFYTNATNGGIIESGFVGGDDFYRCDYDPITYRGKNAIQTIEYELTDSDVTPDTVMFAQQFVLNPPIEMPTGGIIAVTYTFIPGNTFNSGDTLYSSDMPWIKNPRNSFIISYFRDSEPVLDPGFHNYNLSIPTDVQYNQSTGNWNEKYIPGNAWSNSNGDVNYQQNIWFHLSGIVSSTTNISTASSIKLYPNPANNKINIVFNNKNEVKNVTITDVTGRVVYNKKVAANTDVIEVTTEKYTAGIYFCEIKGATTVETIKFTKIK